MRFDHSGRTDVGLRRDHNEDAFLAAPGSGLWVVADGMGGHEFGEWASAVIANMVGRAPLPGDFDQACGAVADSIHASNAAIWREAETRGTQMGSTVVAMLVRDDRFAILWVGDSRAYLLRDGALVQLTKDHSQVQALVDRGVIDEAAAAGHPMSHVLARAVGVQPEVEVDAIADVALPGDIFLLCSDGLSGPVSDAQIAQELAGGDVVAATDRLIALTLEAGAPDNVTVVVLRAQEPTNFVAQPSEPSAAGPTWPPPDAGPTGPDAIGGQDDSVDWGGGDDRRGIGS